MSKRLLTGLILAAVTIGTVMAFAAGAGGSRQQRGGTCRSGARPRIDSLNPYVPFNQDAYSTFMYIYPVLVQYDDKSAKFVPEFATSWKPSKDGKAWTFKTVANAKWS